MQEQNKFAPERIFSWKIVQNSGHEAPRALGSGVKSLLEPHLRESSLLNSWLLWSFPRLE